MNPVIGFAGMTHLGLVSGVCAAEEGFRVVCVDPDDARVAPLRRGELPVSEPKLDELVTKNAARLGFTSNAAELAGCDVIYVAPDVPTDDAGASDLGPVDAMLDRVFSATRKDAVVAVSFTPYASESVALAQAAAARHVPMVAVTDSPFSPLAQIAEVWFEVVEANFEGFRSMAATLSLAMTLTVAVAEKRSQKGPNIRFP